MIERVFMVKKHQHITWRPPFRKPLTGDQCVPPSVSGPSGWFQGYKDGGFEQ